MKQIDFGEIAEFRNGLNYGKDSYGKGSLLIGIPDFKDRFKPDFNSLGEINPIDIIKEEDYLNKNDIIFVRSNGNKALVGRSLFIDRDIKAVFSGFCIRARLTSQIITPLFCAYFTRTDRFKSLIASSGGTSIQNLNQRILANVKIPLFSIKKQNQIAKVLSDLDAKIEVNNKINQELEVMAKTLYDYWFVQVDFPDPSSSSGRNGKPYKSSGGEMVFNEELKREIPEGWEVKELGDISEIKRGKLVTAKTANLEGKFKVVSAGISYSYFHSKSNRTENTITVSGSGANAGFINFWREPIFANDCTTVRGKTDSETLIILEFLRMRQNYIFQQARGSAQPHVYPKDISILKIAVPNNELFNEFGKKILPSNDLISNNLKQNQKLSELRDWLLPMLMNGQVSVGYAEQEVESLGLVAEDGEKYK